MKKLILFCVMTISTELSAQGVAHDGFDINPTNVIGYVVWALLAALVFIFGLLVSVTVWGGRFLTKYKKTREETGEAQITTMSDLLVEQRLTNTKLETVNQTLTNYGTKIEGLETKLGAIEEDLHVVKQDIHKLKSIEKTAGTPESENKDLDNLKGR